MVLLIEAMTKMSWLTMIGVPLPLPHAQNLANSLHCEHEYEQFNTIVSGINLNLHLKVIFSSNVFKMINQSRLLLFSQHMITFWFKGLGSWKNLRSNPPQNLIYSDLKCADSESVIKKYTKPCSFLREKCYKKYIFSLKNTQFAIEMNGEQPSNSTFWHSSSKTNSLTTPDFFVCSSLYWILQNTKRKKPYYYYYYYIYIIIILPYYFSRKMRKTGYF